MSPGKVEFPTTIVRPYSAQIRARVVSLLERVSCRFDPGHLVPAKTTDSVAIDQVISIGNATLLLPFHAHRDGQGQSIDGISFFEQLIVRADDIPWRALMPSTVFGRAALGLRINALPEVLRRQLFVFSTEDARAERAQSTLTPLRAFLHADV
ncbi:MAG: hypothetical protein ACI9KE_000525 [Polyangiales bacterium]